MKFIDFEKLAALFLKYRDKFLIDGVEYTLALAAITVAFGAVFASVLALMKMSKIPPLRWLSTGWITASYRAAKPYHMYRVMLRALND